MSSLNKDPLQALDDEPAGQRWRMSRTSRLSNNSLDGDDLPLEDDLLTEIVPEEQRLKRLHEIQTPFKAEGAEPYKSACLLLSEALQVPITLVSLLYDEYQWFKAGVGLDTSYTPRCFSFCTHTLAPRKPEILYVPDALEDERFRDSPLVQGPPHIRFYCGVPLLTENGTRLGALCIKDRTPRTMDKEVFQFLVNMANILVRELALLGNDKDKTSDGQNLPIPAVPTPTSEGKIRRIPRVRRLREEWFKRGLSEGILVVNATGSAWKVAWTNPRWDEWIKHSGIIVQPDCELWSFLKPSEGKSGLEMQQIISEGVEASDSGAFSFRSQIPGPDVTLAKVVSCNVMLATQPIDTLRNTINFPGEIDTPALGECISFGGARWFVLFVHPTDEEECLPKPTVTTAVAEPLTGTLRKPPEWQRTRAAIPFAAEKNIKAVTEVEETREKKDSVGQPSSANKNKVGKIAKTEEVPDAADHEKEISSKATDICSVFQSYDEEQTGQISREELLKVIRKISPEHERASNVTMMEELIVEHKFDRNGFIVYKDFIKFMCARSA